MRRATTRFWSVVLICTMFMSLPPVGALAEETTEPLALTETTGSLSQTAADDFQSSPGAEAMRTPMTRGGDLQCGGPGCRHCRTESRTDLEDRRRYLQPHPGPSESIRPLGRTRSGRLVFPSVRRSFDLVGEGQVVITSAVESANGAWATQDFVSVWGDGITIDGVDFQSKSVPNKAIEIMAGTSP